MSLDAQLVQYLQDREEQRNREADSILLVMSPRERQLVKEVAVMANVRANHDFRYRPPDDLTVLRNTISACLGMPDLYPTIARLARIAVRRNRKNNAQKETLEDRE